MFFRWLSPLMVFFGYIEPNIEFDVSIFTLKIFVCKVKRSPRSISIPQNFSWRSRVLSFQISAAMLLRGMNSPSRATGLFLWRYNSRPRKLGP